MFLTAQTFLEALFLLLGDNSDRSRTLVKEFLDATEKASAKKDIMTTDDDLVIVYKALIKDVLSERITQENRTAAKILLLNIRNNEVIKAHPIERDLLIDVLTAEEPISSTQIDKYTKKLRNALMTAEMDAASRKIFAKVKMISEIHDVDDQEYELEKIKTLYDETLKSIDARQKISDGKASETYVSLSDHESLIRAFEVFTERNVRGVIRTGWQGLNRALGSRGGFGRGECFVFGASSHNFKSGMLLLILVWTVIYNKIFVAPGKKALAYFVSLENEVNQNLMAIFRVLYGRIEKKHIDMTYWTPERMADWLKVYFDQFDIELIMDRYTPHEFSYRKYIQRFNSFVDQNYEMVLFDLDYMSEACGIDPGDTFSMQGKIQLIKENYVKFRSHANQCGYFLATGHQLTKEAEKMAANDRYAIKKFNPSLMADSSDVHRTVDGLFYLQLVSNVDGVKFLMCQNRKNRGCMDTPEKDKFFAYPFTEFGIMDDIDDLPGYVTDIDAYGDGNDGHDRVVEEAMF